MPPDGPSDWETQHLSRTAGGGLAPTRTALEFPLFQRDRDLFTQTLDLLFLDTTSVFVWRDRKTPPRRPGRCRPVAPNLEVKEVTVGERRYVVCGNPEEAARGAAARTALGTHLETTLARQGPKALLKTKGFASFLTIRNKQRHAQPGRPRRRHPAGWQVRPPHQHRLADDRGRPGLQAPVARRAHLPDGGGHARGPTGTTIATTPPSATSSPASSHAGLRSTSSAGLTSAT